MRLENEALIRDLVRWVDANPKPYAEVMAAWRTSCPRLSIWEDAVDAGLVKNTDGIVSATEKGRALLAVPR